MYPKKYLIPGIILVIVIVGGVYAYSRRHKSQPSTTNQFEQNINKMMAIVNNPKSTKADVEGAWLQIGINYESLGQRDKEEQALLKASETDPNSYIPWSSLGTLYVETKTYDKAAQALQKALALPSGSADPQLWLKWINFNIYQIGSDDKHIRLIFNDAYTATHNNDLLLRQGASYLEMIGDYPGAIAAWQAVLKESPNDQAVKAAITADQAKLKK